MPPMGVEYSIDIIDLTTSLDFTIFNTPKEGAIAALEAASEEENATSEGGASCDPRVEPISSGVVPAGEPAAQPGVTPSTARVVPFVLWSSSTGASYVVAAVAACCCHCRNERAPPPPTRTFD